MTSESIYNKIINKLIEELSKENYMPEEDLDSLKKLLVSEDTKHEAILKFLREVK